MGLACCFPLSLCYAHRHAVPRTQVYQEHNHIKHRRMSTCRGIVVAGVTNQARTQMAEAFLRAFTGGRVFVCSGGVHHLGTVHPLAVTAMAEMGIDVSRQSSSSLAGVRRQRDTYDVYVSVDAPYTERTSDRYQRRYADTQAAQQNSMGASGLSASCASSTSDFCDPLLASATPAHWTVSQDTTDGRQSWTLWSPRNPAIYHERSTRKLQDHLYEGEPLFMRVRPHELRKACRVQRRWEVPELTQRFALETEAEQKARFVQARDLLGSLALALVRDLEREYGETMLDEATVAAYEKVAAMRCGP
ncbi:hypothetical protein, conserved [Leishmania donovani]|uniref:Phosphotyrosine protein phosphatase I domain-containing protein n=2 Tax=Leishmania donovani TaxID=5661 RepID=E9B784_LEIDO|nr:hypothetical protein, conserved [Leishmania donovani]CBZ31107.1 hypothetical protein, conserved [Leishmania donovani]